MVKTILATSLLVTLTLTGCSSEETTKIETTKPPVSATPPPTTPTEIEPGQTYATSFPASFQINRGMPKTNEDGSKVTSTPKGFAKPIMLCEATLWDLPNTYKDETGARYIEDNFAIYRTAVLYKTLDEAEEAVASFKKVFTDEPCSYEGETPSFLKIASVEDSMYGTIVNGYMGYKRKNEPAPGGIWYAIESHNNLVVVQEIIDMKLSESNDLSNFQYNSEKMMSSLAKEYSKLS